jgi:hypothetical protein
MKKYVLIAMMMVATSVYAEKTVNYEKINSSTAKKTETTTENMTRVEVLDCKDTAQRERQRLITQRNKRLEKISEKFDGDIAEYTAKIAICDDALTKMDELEIASLLLI